VVVAKEVWVECGKKAISWEILVAVLNNTVTRHVWVREVFSLGHMQSLLSLRFSQSQYATGDEVHHYQILGRHRRAAAKDPRDKVYAFYGLYCQQSLQQIGIRPDYTISTEELYIDVAKSTLQAATDLDYLSVERSSGTLALPSWVPDWNSYENFQCSFLGLEQYGQAEKIQKLRPYAATNDSTYSLSEAVDESNRLLAFGYLIDEIASLNTQGNNPAIRMKQSLVDQARKLQSCQDRMYGCQLHLNQSGTKICRQTPQSPASEAEWLAKCDACRPASLVGA
jgi:hypothetical protein